MNRKRFFLLGVALYGAVIAAGAFINAPKAHEPAQPPGETRGVAMGAVTLSSYGTPASSGTISVSTGTFTTAVGLVSGGTISYVTTPTVMNYAYSTNGGILIANGGRPYETVTIDGISRAGYRDEDGGITVDQNCTPHKFTPEQHLDMVAGDLGRTVGSLKKGEAPEQLAHRKASGASQFAAR